MKWLLAEALAVALLSAGLASPEEHMTWSFDKDKPGVFPPGFSSQMGEWKVESDMSAPSKGNVLAQRARNSGSAFNLVFVKGTSYKDLDVSVKMKAVAGSEDQGGGLVWRAKDNRNYYVARFNPLEDNYRVYKVENGRRSQFENANQKGDKNWHTLRVTMKGDQIQCFLDGKKHMEVHDSTFANAGMIGLWTKADAQTHFDDLMVSTP